MKTTIICTAIFVAWFAVLATPWGRHADIDAIYPALAVTLPRVAAILSLGICAIVLWVCVFVVISHGRKFMKICFLFPLLVLCMCAGFIAGIYMFLSWMLFVRGMTFYTELAVSMSLTISIILFLRTNTERINHISEELDKVTSGTP